MARTIADHLTDLLRRDQADGDIRADADPEAAAWLLLSILPAQSFLPPPCRTVPPPGRRSRSRSPSARPRRTDNYTQCLKFRMLAS